MQSVNELLKVINEIIISEPDLLMKSEETICYFTDLCVTRHFTSYIFVNEAVSITTGH